MMLGFTDRQVMIGVARPFDRLTSTLKAIQAWPPDQVCAWHSLNAIQRSQTVRRASTMQDASIGYALLSESLRGRPLSFARNQACAAQVIAVDKQIGSDLTRINVNRGAIARGPPLDLSDFIGNCVAAKMVRREHRKACPTLCIDRGMRVGLITERQLQLRRLFENNLGDRTWHELR